MDVLFGAVTAETRRRDRLVVHNNLMGTGVYYPNPNQSFKESDASMTLALQDVSESKSFHHIDGGGGGSHTTPTTPSLFGNLSSTMIGMSDSSSRHDRERRASLSKAIPTPLNVHFDFHTTGTNQRALRPGESTTFDEEDYKRPFTPTTMTPTDTGVDRGVWTIPECVEAEEEARESSNSVDDKGLAL